MESLVYVYIKLPQFIVFFPSILSLDIIDKNYVLYATFFYAIVYGEIFFWKPNVR